MLICAVCSKECDDASAIKCAGMCGVSAHANCVKADGKKNLRSNREWRCKDCGNKTPTAGSAASASSGHSELTKDFIVKVMEAFKTEVFQELKSFKNDMLELTKSVQFISDKIDSSTALMEELRTQFADLKRENAELRSENEVICQELTELRERTRELEQYSRRNNIEISGVPMTDGERMEAVVKDVGAALGLQVEPAEVAAAHRVPSFKRGREQSIIVQFNNRARRDQWIAKYREKRQLTAKEINPAFPSSRVFVNDHLSPANKQFYARVKQRCRDVGYSFAWCRDAKFFVKKSPDDRLMKISTLADIEKIK
ncbi:hypothetical protein J6590_108730 [Homalodisca vitripennis]|nr:hypothetical protein J6590_108730 [Homalodisca vitripennis]